VVKLACANLEKGQPSLIKDGTRNNTDYTDGILAT
jgi:hypothetical protein